MLGFAFFFTCGFIINSWGWSWISLALAAVGVFAVSLIEKAKK
jgi:hypothetical protein